MWAGENAKIILCISVLSHFSLPFPEEIKLKLSLYTAYCGIIVTRIYQNHLSQRFVIIAAVHMQLFAKTNLKTLF